ncbi:hypothetical protein MMC25_003706 [Agyrium rufum]|nr:hypothetical protein [Agyrium rufum]
MALGFSLTFVQPGGGSGFTGPNVCTTGWSCIVSNQYFSNCFQNANYTVPPDPTPELASPGAACGDYAVEIGRSSVCVPGFACSDPTEQRIQTCYTAYCGVHHSGHVQKVVNPDHLVGIEDIVKDILNDKEADDYVNQVDIEVINQNVDHLEEVTHSNTYALLEVEEHVDLAPVSELFGLWLDPYTTQVQNRWEGPGFKVGSGELIIRWAWWIASPVSCACQGYVHNLTTELEVLEKLVFNGNRWDMWAPID